MANTVSITTLPPNSVPTCWPSRTTTGRSAGRATARQTTRRCRKPARPGGAHVVGAPGLDHAGAQRAQCRGRA